MNHISYDSGKFHDLAPCQPGTFVITGDGEQHPITHVGDIRLPISMSFLSLRRVFLVPSFRYNLLSISQLTRDFQAECYPFSCIFEGSHLEDSVR